MPVKKLTLLMPSLQRLLLPSLMPMLLRAEIQARDFQRQPPVLIYQMGKVGSSTLRKSLRRSPLSNPVYQIHRLSPEGIQRYEESCQRFPHSRYLQECLAISQTLHHKLFEQEPVPVKLITLTRDPIALLVSAFFESLTDRAERFSQADGRLDREALIQKIHRRLKRLDESSNPILSWFESELKVTFGLDVFEFPFTPTVGWQRIQQGTVDLLILRLEDLDRVGSAVLTEFLELRSPLQLVTANQRQHKAFAADYDYVKANLHLPRRVCRRLYQSRYATHFYSEAERHAFTAKWTTGVL